MDNEIVGQCLQKDELVKQEELNNNSIMDRHIAQQQTAEKQFVAQELQKRQDARDARQAAHDAKQCSGVAKDVPVEDIVQPQERGPEAAPVRFAAQENERFMGAEKARNLAVQAMHANELTAARNQVLQERQDPAGIGPTARPELPENQLGKVGQQSPQEAQTQEQQGRPQLPENALAKVDTGGPKPAQEAPERGQGENERPELPPNALAQASAQGGPQQAPPEREQPQGYGYV